MCWGSNFGGQLGNNSTVLYTHIPVNVFGLSSEVSAIVAAYGSLTCALTTTGGVKCWGYNWEGQLGNNSTTDSHIPVDVSGLSSGVSAIAAGLYHTCALMMTRSMKCWGDNRDGQLGNNSTISSLVPVDVYGVTPPSFYVYLPLVLRH
jgi:alpha-tubulin suppressor-like RCC1 family protein